MKKNYKANQTFNTVVRFLLGIYLRHKFRLEADCEKIKGLKGPYIILGNHVNNWDPFMVSIPVKEPIHFVAGEGTFKNPILRWALIHLVGAIPKTKFIPDSATIRQIIRVKNSGGIIGIFPEGQRNWNGVTGELMYSTAKLIKSLKLPVVTVVLKGAYLSHPRWAEKSRKGKIEMVYSLALTAENVRAMREDEIFNTISGRLYHAEAQWQKENRVAYKGANAERLERFLFACPHCGGVETLESKGSIYTCKNCGYAVEYDVYGELSPKSDTMHFDSLYEWDKWQLESLQERLSSISEGEMIFQCGEVTLYEGKRMKSFSSKLFGGLTLYKDKLIFEHEGKQISFKIADMDGANVNFTNKLEFSYDKSMYRIVFKNNLISAYMWACAVVYLQALEKESRRKIEKSSKVIVEVP